MALKFSVAVRNGILDTIEDAIGTPTLKIFTGAKPSTLAYADSGTVLATMVLASDWLGSASGGSISRSAGDWEDLSADNTGTAGHFRIYDDGPVAMIQGTVTATGGGGDMTLDNVSVASGQTITVTTFTITAGN
jgi:hypothetical protein